MDRGAVLSLPSSGGSSGRFPRRPAPDVGGGAGAVRSRGRRRLAISDPRDPLEETNLRHLASTGAELDRASAWMDKFDKAFGHGISGGFAVRGKESRKRPRRWCEGCGTWTRASSERQRLFSRISSLDDRFTANQEEKLAVLAEESVG